MRNTCLRRLCCDTVTPTAGHVKGAVIQTGCHLTCLSATQTNTHTQIQTHRQTDVQTHSLHSYINIYRIVSQLILMMVM